MKKILFISFLFFSIVTNAQIINLQKFDNEKMKQVMFIQLQGCSKDLLLVKSGSLKDPFIIKDTIVCTDIITYQDIASRYISRWKNEDNVNHISMILLKDFACKMNIKSLYKSKEKKHIIICLFDYN